MVGMQTIRRCDVGVANVENEKHPRAKPKENLKPENEDSTFRRLAENRAMIPIPRRA